MMTDQLSSRDQTLSLDDVVPGRQYINCHVTYSNHDIRVSEVSFTKCTFQQLDFKASEWLDCQFQNCQFLNAAFQRSHLYRCRFTDCQLLGSDFSGSQLKDLTVTTTHADYCNFSETTLTGCQFTDVQLRETSFQAITIKRFLRFTRCDLTQADFMDSALKNVDLRTSTLTALNFTPDLIRGCIIEPLQAVTFVTALGVDIQD